MESLAAARQSGGGSEPADSVRAVNALLTQLDALKSYSNVMVSAVLCCATPSVDRFPHETKCFVGCPHCKSGETTSMRIQLQLHLAPATPSFVSSTEVVSILQNRS